MTINHRPAAHDLTQALVRLAAAGGRPPCGEPGDHALWTSDNASERAVAVVLCTSCPVLDVCGRAGDENGEPYVWGGRDHGSVPPKHLRRVEA